MKTRVDQFDRFEGCLLKTKQTYTSAILLNENIENKRRQRFTHAHELGHFMCHRNMQGRFEDRYDDSKVSGSK
jgi:Zn-dependent peptidase ImmA (M78 family)